jgi:hypothetical protein
MNAAMQALAAVGRWFDRLFPRIELKHYRQYQFLEYRFAYYVIPSKGLWRTILLNTLGMLAWVLIIIDNEAAWTVLVGIFYMFITGYQLYRWAHLAFLQRTGTRLPIGSLINSVGPVGHAEEIYKTAKQKKVPVRILVRGEEAEAWFRNDDEAVLIRMTV